MNDAQLKRQTNELVLNDNALCADITGEVSRVLGLFSNNAVKQLCMLTSYCYRVLCISVVLLGYAGIGA